MESYNVRQLNVVSDIHLTALYWTNVLMDLDVGDKEEDGIIIAGDIAVPSRLGLFRGLFEMLSSKYKHIFIILGNHDYWDSNLIAARDLYSNFLIDFSNIHLMNASEPFRVNDYIMVGDTLWTNFGNNNPRSKLLWKHEMNDGRYISDAFVYYRSVNVEEIHKEHDYHFNKIKKIVEDNPNDKFIIVTHHAPSELSVSGTYRGHYINDYYYSDLSKFILDNTHIRYWIHGHMHQRTSYRLGETTVVCNAYGYHGETLGSRFELINLFEVSE